MSNRAVLSTLHTQRLRQFVEHADARLLVLMADGQQASFPGQSAEIARLQKLREAVLRVLNEAEA